MVKTFPSLDCFVSRQAAPADETLTKANEKKQEH
jgi:hypothetical protein